MPAPAVLSYTYEVDPRFRWEILAKPHLLCVSSARKKRKRFDLRSTGLCCQGGRFYNCVWLDIFDLCESCDSVEE